LYKNIILYHLNISSFIVAIKGMKNAANDIGDKTKDFATSAGKKL
jgi:hypothetical protein